jgi:hypothetical protein
MKTIKDFLKDLKDVEDFLLNQWTQSFTQMCVYLDISKKRSSIQIA